MLHNPGIDMAREFVSEDGITEIDNSTHADCQRRPPKFECHKPPEGPLQRDMVAAQTVDGVNDDSCYHQHRQRNQGGHEPAEKAARHNRRCRLPNHFQYGGDVGESLNPVAPIMVSCWSAHKY